MDFELAKITLEKAVVIFKQGLSEEEIIQIEEDFHFLFPPDLKGFLSYALPISRGFMNWRSNSRESIKKSMD